MKPRGEFVAANAGAAVLLHWAVALGWMQPWRQLNPIHDLRSALLWMPGPLLAAGLAAWLTSAWQRRASARRRPVTASGLAWRTVLLALLLYPLATTAWIVLIALADQVWAAQPAPLAETLRWLPLLVAYALGSAVIAGTLLAMIIEYFLCRRYLRRVASVSTSTP